MRLAHPQAPTVVHNQLFHWMTQGWDATTLPATAPDDSALQTIWAFEQAKQATSVGDVQRLVEGYGLPWEAIPTQWLAEADVWRTLLPHLPLTALQRNLARLTANGVLLPLAPETAQVTARLSDAEQLRWARVYPVAVLAALLTYRHGKGARGGLTWNPVTAVSDALDQAFYRAFQNVEATGKRLVLALDVSGSMSLGVVAGVPGLTPRVASAAMALVTAATEEHVIVVGFSHQMVRLNISPRQRLDDAVQAVSGLPFGATDVAQPMLWALANGVQTDAFVVYTDSETWYGNVHPSQALQECRWRTGIPAKLVVVGMVANRFSVADPNDAGMLDVVGFDTAVPTLIADFIRE
ncbi:MAG: hypothetical protein BroJett015_21060 [Chloroflexota bacterium]|nr:MAG: hypothetical protein BroJett015_21060 [Chloroflexota bacterium]